MGELLDLSKFSKTSVISPPRGRLEFWEFCDPSLHFSVVHCMDLSLSFEECHLRRFTACPPPLRLAAVPRLNELLPLSSKPSAGIHGKRIVIFWVVKLPPFHGTIPSVCLTSILSLFTLGKPRPGVYRACNSIVLSSSLIGYAISGSSCIGRLIPSKVEEILIKSTAYLSGSLL